MIEKQREPMDEGNSGSSKNISLGLKFALTGAVSVLVTAAALVIIAIWQSGIYNKHAQQEVDILITTDLSHISQVVYNLVHTENEAVKLQVSSNLNVASYILSQYGKPALSKDTVKWQAKNQFTNEIQEITVPRFLIGNKWIEKNPDFAVKTPVIDDIIGIVGETATIFQRMNEQGDMLRVATNVKTSEQTRAIGTYIPSLHPDGAEDPVISTVLKGETYLGRAFVVNNWYITTYKPLYSIEGSLIGMLYVGIKQEYVEARIRQAIIQTKVGKTGYVYVLEGSGKKRGSYIISYRGERDGENIWLTRDSDGRYVIQEIINKALSLKPGEMDTIRYRWQNIGEPYPRWKIANLVYYEPWDWVIGTSVYEDELQTYSTWLNDGRKTMINIMGIAGIIITFIVGVIFVFITLKITRPVKDMTIVAEKITSGDLDQVITVKSDDEIGILARTFNHMTGKLKDTMNNLVKSEEKYRGIFENAIEGLFQSTIEGVICSANPAMARILGYRSPEELMASVKDAKKQFYVNPTDREKLIEILKEQGEVFEYEVEFYRKNREKIWVSISTRIIETATNETPMLEGFITNITARKKAEEALAESKLYLDEIINAVADPVFVKDHKHRFVLVNNAMCEFLEKERSRILGRTDYDFVKKEEADLFIEKDRSVLDTGRESFNEELFTDSDNNVHTLITKKTLYKDRTGNKFIVGITRDITDQKKAEEEKIRLEARLIQSEKMEAIGTLAGGIAHDFNNILSVIIGYTELAMHQMDECNIEKDDLNEVLLAGERARDLVKQILTFSRMDKSELSPIVIKDVISDSIRMLRAVIPSNIEIRKKIDIEGYILSNPTHINQIMLNLCSNAAHSMDATGGILEISLDKATIEGPDNPYGINVSQGKYIRITVSDTGKGMTPEVRGRIFEPYFTTKETGKGTGLGLSVIHGIVKTHNGEITCRANEEKGTTFEVFLPETDTTQEKGIRDLDIEFKKGTGKILIIDDEPTLVKLVAEMLKRIGYDIVSTTSSKEGLEIFNDSPNDFDLVITDMTMPGITGDMLAKEMISIRKDIPVILCTGFNEHISEREAHKIGIREFIMKPVNMKMLSEAIDRVIGHRQELTGS